jgi:hypothetical protein
LTYSQKEFKIHDKNIFQILKQLNILTPLDNHKISLKDNLGISFNKTIQYEETLILFFQIVVKQESLKAYNKKETNEN